MHMMETSVTTKVINELDPKISSMKSELREDLCSDMRRLVQEEVELMRLREAKEKPNPAEDSSEVEDKGQGPEKNKKSKKKNKK